MTASRIAELEAAAQILRAMMKELGMSPRPSAILQDRARKALAALSAPAAPEGAVGMGWKLVPIDPTDELLKSMAVRYDHGLGVPGYYDEPVFGAENVGHAKRLESTIRTMRQLHEEVVGAGFYRASPPPAALGVEEVAIKPLDLVKPYGSETLTRADTIVGEACVWTHHEANSIWFWKLGHVAAGEGSNEADATKMLVATYEARIRSALLPQPEPEGAKSVRAMGTIGEEGAERTIYAEVRRLPATPPAPTDALKVAVEDVRSISAETAKVIWREMGCALFDELVSRGVDAELVVQAVEACADRSEAEVAAIRAKEEDL